MNSDSVNRLVVGISGASGTVYAVRLLQELSRPSGAGRIKAGSSIDVHVIVTHAAREVARHETGAELEGLLPPVAALYDDDDISAPPASGSFKTMGMVVVPCSIGTLSAVATSSAQGLLARAADVELKERRPLVLVVRETPLHLGHLRLMLQAAEAGAIILPPVPAFYHRPSDMDDLVGHTVGKILDMLGLPHRLYAPWEGPQPEAGGQGHADS
jgi:4-hydroxy-3-polyprenylbenzoate decarboxylase